MSKGPSTTTKDTGSQQVQLPQWMSDAGKTLFDKSMADSAAHPVTGYKGELSAPMDANQTAAAQQAKDNANAGQSQVASGTTAVQAGTKGFTGADAAAYMSPYIDDVQKRTVSDILRNGTMQLADLGDNAAANHAFGGTREAVAQGEATKGINSNILNYLADSNQGAFENAQQQFNTDADRKIAGGSALGNLGQQASGISSDGVNNLLKTGTVAQQTRDAADQAKYGEALRMQDGTINRDEDLMAILAGTPRNVTTNTTGKSTSTQNPGWLSTVMGVGGMAASAFSDARLKRDIVRVGQLSDGLPVHDFNYRDGLGLPEGRFRGVLAHDVERYRPDALGPITHGFATVDASLAPQLIGD